MNTFTYAMILLAVVATSCPGLVSGARSVKRAAPTPRVLATLQALNNNVSAHLAADVIRAKAHASAEALVNPARAIALAARASVRVIPSALHTVALAKEAVLPALIKVEKASKFAADVARNVAYSAADAACVVAIGVANTLAN